MKKQFMTSNEAETIAFGRKIGALLQGGEMLLLNSDLGGGKTTLTKGIAIGLKSTDQVSSPTFTLSQIYRGKSLELHHYDLYRLGELGLMDEELREVLERQDVVTVIEWPDLARSTLPEQRVIYIEIERLQQDEDLRQFTVSYPENFAYLYEAEA